MNPAWSIILHHHGGLRPDWWWPLPWPAWRRTWAAPSLLAGPRPAGGGAGGFLLPPGHRMRAWRAALMWRTSWMSREVIVLPAFIGLVGAWAVAALAGAPDVLVLQVLPVLAIARRCCCGCARR